MELVLPGSALLLAGGGDAWVRGVRLEPVVELGHVGQDGETVGAASGHVRHVQQGADTKVVLSSMKGSLTVPEIVESYEGADQGTD